MSNDESILKTSLLDVLRLRSHTLWSERMALGEFLSALQDLFLRPNT